MEEEGGNYQNEYIAYEIFYYSKGRFIVIISHIFSLNYRGFTSLKRKQRVQPLHNVGNQRGVQYGVGIAAKIIFD